MISPGSASRQSLEPSMLLARHVYFGTVRVTSSGIAAAASCSQTRAIWVVRPGWKSPWVRLSSRRYGVGRGGTPGKDFSPGRSIAMSSVRVNRSTGRLVVLVTSRLTNQ